MNTNVLEDINFFLMDNKFQVYLNPKNEKRSLTELSILIKKNIEEQYFSWLLQIIDLTENRSLFENKKILQFYVQMGTIQNKDSIPGIIVYLNSVNNKLTIGNFAVIEEENFLIFKYNSLFNLNSIKSSYDDLLDEINIISNQLLIYQNAFMEMCK
jgi:hypothetical protein